MSGATKLSVLVSLFEWTQKTKSSAQKRSKFRKFLDTFCKPEDYFSAIRLILPGLDRERGSYGLKESVLATLLIDALGMARDSPDALRLINWRKGGAKTGANAGNFALVAAEVLQRRQGMASGGLTIKELNDLLDRLALSENRAEKTSVLSDLIKKTNAQEMKWIVMIVLKDLKLGISEKSIFHEFHPDAEDLFNVTCDLKLVCEKLKDRSQRHKRQDIEVGKAVRPQLARRVANAHAAWKMLHGKEVVVERKFDGDRIQIHKNGDEMHYFSSVGVWAHKEEFINKRSIIIITKRNFLDHSEYAHGMSDIIMKNVLAQRCILDGEMLVWDASQNRFAEFGSNQEIAKAAKDGFDSDRQLCYVAFDILYIGDTSVIHQSLKERHELLQKFVVPLKGRLEILVPNGGLNAHCLLGEPCWSFIAHNVNDVEKFFRETIENRDEGIILKDMGSKWEPSDRSGKWLKLKPDYVNPGSDLDVLIIGGYYGSGRHGGEVAQFLVGLAERSSPDAYPNRFISFCRVGTGLSDDELEAVVSKLKPYFRKYQYPQKAAPSFYHVTNNSKERPDVWIESPEKSIILSITSDIRTIRSEVFAAPYSLRFPRIDRVRYDKPWHECLDVQSFVELVHSSNGTTQKGNELEGFQDRKPTHIKSSRKGHTKNVSVVPSHFVQTDVSDVKGESFIFSNMIFYFVNVPPTHSLDVLHKMVAENGGSFSMNLNNSVTHCVAAESKGIKYQAARLRGDVIHYSWVLDCCLQKRLLPLQPKYFLFLSNLSKKKLQKEIDEFSDSYYCDIDLADIKQLLGNIKTSRDTSSIEYYTNKYCPKNKWSLFYGSCIYFYISMGSKTPDLDVSLELALRRLKLDVLMAGGRVTNNLSDATHLVVLITPGSNLDYESLMECFTPADKWRLREKRFHVIRSQWLENSLQCEQKLDELTYSLNVDGSEALNIQTCEHTEDINESPPTSRQIGNQKLLSLSAAIASKEKGEKDAPEDSHLVISSKRDTKRKTALAGESKNKMRTHRQTRTKRMRLGKRSAKIRDEESDERASFDGEANEEIQMINIPDHSGVQKLKIGEDSESSFGGKTGEDIPEAEGLERQPRNAPDIEMGESNDRREGHSDVDMNARHSAAANEKPEKLEVMVDPVHAMLMDMFPSLGKNRSEAVTQNSDNKAQEDVASSAVPVKKKRVSYKDIAWEMLKDS